MSAVTQWFANGIKPAKIGCYEVKPGCENPLEEWKFSYWDGTTWSSADSTPQKAKESQTLSYCMYTVNSKWRGLAENPNKKESE
jgi:hypothetical protein